MAQKGGITKDTTSFREALRLWEEDTGEKVTEATEVRLVGVYPPIDKTDPSLQNLTSCEKLCLSTNCIEKMAHISTLTKLRILSLGRNNIKSFAGLEVLGESLEQLWISYNQIEKLKGVNSFRKLKVLYMSNNLVKDWAEFGRLIEVPTLEELNFVGNPLEEKHSIEGNWRAEVEKRLAFLKKLDGVPIIRDIDDLATLHQQTQPDPDEDEHLNETIDEDKEVVESNKSPESSDSEAETVQ